MKKMPPPEITSSACSGFTDEQIRLFQQAETRYYEFGKDWFHLLADKALAPGEICRMWQVADPQEPRVLLPLLERPASRELSSLSTWYTSLYSPILSESASIEDLTSLFRRLRLDHSGWRSLRLSPMDPASTEFHLTQTALRRAGWITFPFFMFGNWRLPTHGQRFDDYLKTLPGRLRATLKRKTPRLLTHDGCLKIITGGAELEQAIEDWTNIYLASWKTPEPFPDFVPSLIRLSAAKGWLRLGLAYQEGRPIAGQFWIVHQGRAAIYKLAQDQRHDRLSPGTLLTAHLLRHVMDIDQVSEVDYLIGDDEYKRDWMHQRHERWGLIAYNPATAKGLASALHQTIWRTAKRLLQSLGLQSAASSPIHPPK